MIRYSCYFLRLITFWSIAATAWVAAQEGEERIRTEFLTVSVNQDLPPLHYLNNGKPAVLEVFMTGMGSPLSYRGPRVLRLFASEADLTPVEGAPVPVPLAQVLLPSEGRVVLLFSKGGAADEIQLRALGINADKLRAGDYQFFNYSRQSIAILLGSEKLALRAGEQSSLSAAAWRQGFQDLDVKLGLAGAGGAIRPVYSSVWGHRPERRSLIMIFDQADPNRPLDVRRFYDVPGVAAMEVNEPMP
jgi:hypothetical protein